MRPTPYVASLRIYEPLSSFDPADQLRWKNLSATENTARAEEELALRRIISPEPPSGRPDGAHVIDLDGIRYVSPWATATRCWAALETSKDRLPTSVFPLFVSPAMEEVITTGIDLLEDKVPYILNETWVIPPRWFSLFLPEDRLRGNNQDGAFTVLCTKISDARARCEVAHNTVIGAFGEGPVEQEIENLLDWLDMFHPKSLVELDYGGLAQYLESALIQSGEAGLEADTSVEDVLHSLAGLAAGDGSLAGQGYERLITRWRRVQAFEQAM